jgi:hypothetical protein
MSVKKNTTKFKIVKMRDQNMNDLMSLNFETNVNQGNPEFTDLVKNLQALQNEQLDNH